NTTSRWLSGPCQRASFFWPCCPRCEWPSNRRPAEKGAHCAGSPAANSHALYAADMLHALGNEPTALVMQTLGIFRLDAGSAHHAARRLAGEITRRSTNHPVGSAPIVVV